MKRKEFAIIGLGKFGGAICRELIDLGMQVMVIDKDEDRVNEFANIATHTVIADSTDEAVLKSLSLRNFDHIIVAIGDDLQASILTTLLLKEFGVEKVTAKAKDNYHKKVLEKIGADEVIQPEHEIGTRIAHRLVSTSVLDYIELSDEYSIIELRAGKKLQGKTLQQLNVRAKFSINIVAIQRGDRVMSDLSADYMILAGDILVLIGADENLNKFEDWMD